MTSPAPTRILTADQLSQKIRRIAFQIYENNFEEPALVLAGIAGEGYVFAQRLVQELTHIAPFSVQLLQVDIDKKQAMQPVINLGAEAAVFAGKVVVMADDVLNSGRTLAFSMQPFLTAGVRKLQVAVLVDRNHPCYPVAADYVGYQLATTLTDHVDVVLSDGERVGVYLR